MNNIVDIVAIKQLFLQYVWNSPIEDKSALQRRLVTALRIAHMVIRDLMDGMINLRAMGLVYTTILALVPLLAVSFSVLKGFGVHNQVEPMLLNLLQPLGEQGVEISDRIIGFVNNTKAGVLGSLGLLLLIYTVISLLQKIEKAFNYTWRVPHNRPLAQRFSDYLSITLIGPLLLFSALGITATVSNMAFVQQAMEIEVIGGLIEFAARLVPYMLVISAFTFIYMLVPNIRVKFKSALYGGIIAGILWETVSWAFTTFIVSSTKYTAIYSAFASIIIFFIWIYMNWMILLIGSSISSYHQQPSQRNLNARVIRLSNRMRERFSLIMMTLIARHYHCHKKPWSIEALAEYMNISTDVSDLLIQRLVAADVLIATSDTPARYVPAYDLSTTSLVDLLSSIRDAGESGYLTIQSVHAEPIVDEIADSIDLAINETLAGKTLYDLAQSSESPAEAVSAKSPGKSSDKSPEMTG